MKPKQKKAFPEYVCKWQCENTECLKTDKQTNKHTNKQTNKHTHGNSRF